MTTLHDDPDSIARAVAFNKFLRRRGERLRYYELPSQYISTVHEIARQAFLAGARFERRQQEPVQTGGVD